MNVTSNPRIIAIVVARMGSTRVPGKSLLDLCGHPVIWHVVQAAKRIRGISEVCLATSDMVQDDPLAALASDEGIKCYRGDAERVLDRIYWAMKMMDGDIVIEIGGDCPLLDPEILSEALIDYLASPCDYLCNYEPPTFPEGMDVNIISRPAIEKAWREAVAPSQRVHPFSYLTYHPELFVIRNFTMTPDLSRHHWSLDFPEDIALVTAAFEKLWSPGRQIHLNDILKLIQHDHDFAKLDHDRQTPKVSHAFWNSPGMVRDMHDDLLVLAKGAYEAQARREYAKARDGYSELMRIADKLHNEAAVLAQ